MLIYPKKITETKFIVRDSSLIVFLMGFAFLIPMLVALIYGESSWYLYPLLTLFVSGGAYSIRRIFRSDEEPFTRLTIVTLAVVWIVACIIGALPFIAVGGMSGLDGTFESVSSISTAGLTNIQSPDSTLHSILFWRALLAWLGGLGITAIAFYGVMQSESLSKIVLGEGYARLRPSLINSAREIFKIYGFWTITGILLLVVIGVPIFDSFSIAMNAISTTGVDVHDTGWLYYQQTLPGTFGFMTLVVAMLMIMGAISFVAHYRVLKSRTLRAYIKDSETRAYFFILLVGVLLISAYLLATGGQDVAAMAYEGLSTSTTGGFELSPYITNGAPEFVMGILIVLALVGGSTNSAAGGLKVQRLYLILKYLFWNVGRQLFPKGTVAHFRHGDRNVTDREIGDVSAYLIIYGVAVMIVTMFMISLGYGGMDSLYIVSSAQSGGGLSPIPAWELFWPVKVALICTMLFGRLEFMPLFALGIYAMRKD